MSEVRIRGLTQEDINERRERFDQVLESRMRNEFGVKNPLVFEAFKKVDRRAFAPVGYRALSYHDRTIPLNSDASSTISQPSLVGAMIEHLQPTGTGRVLEIGTASGYNAALLSTCYDKVDTIEYDEEIAFQASHTLKVNGFNNVRVHVGDGAEGIPGDEGYDGIIVTAGAKFVPKPLLNQLKVDGRMVIPVGQTPYEQRLLQIEKNDDASVAMSEQLGVTFVPFMSEKGGWNKKDIKKAESSKEYAKELLEVICMYMGPQEIAEILAHVYENVARPRFSTKVFPYLYAE